VAAKAGMEMGLGFCDIEGEHSPELGVRFRNADGDFGMGFKDVDC